MSQIFNFFSKVMLFVSLVCLSSSASSDPITAYVSSIDDHHDVATWVMNNARTDAKVDYDTALKITRAAYAAGISNQVDPLLLLAFARKESGFKINARSQAVPYPAVGLMQVIPYWHRDKIAGRNIYKPEISFDVGAKVYKQCLDRNKNNVRRAMSCYSAYPVNRVHLYMDVIFAQYKELRVVVST